MILARYNAAAVHAPRPGHSDREKLSADPLRLEHARALDGYTDWSK